jgi:hypothetical protein
MQTTQTKEKRYWLYYFSMHQLDTRSHHPRFHSLRGWVWSVSVWVRKDANDIDKRKTIWTLLFFRASARYWAPFLWIWFHPRLTAVRVFVRKKRCKQQTQEKRYWPHCFSEHQLDIWPHCRRCCWIWGWVRLESVWETKDANDTDKRKKDMNRIIFQSIS